MKIYKITEASEYLGVSINTLKTLANNGKIKSFKTTGCTKNKRYQGDTTMKTEEQREHNQDLACLVDDIAFKASLLRIAEKALEDIRGLCVSSTYWNNPDYLDGFFSKLS